MSRETFRIRVDLSEFTKGMKKLVGKTFPQKTALYFQQITMAAQKAARNETRKDFNLKSDFIPKSILNFPNSPGQLKKAANDIKYRHEMFASVYLRPASQPKYALSFMVNHEFGDPKIAHKGNSSVAIPIADIKKYSYRTSRGKTKKSWKPENLLRRYNQMKNTHWGNLRGKSFASANRAGKMAGDSIPFIKKTKSGKKVIVRRRAGKKGLEYLYVFKKKARIRPVWGFIPISEAAVNNTYKMLADKIYRKLLP